VFIGALTAVTVLIRPTVVAAKAYESTNKQRTSGIYDIVICMRTTLDLPVSLIDEARATLGFKSKTDTVVFALREAIRRGRVDTLKSLMGRVTFEFDPGELRRQDRKR
jgi:hypothetical protein